MNSNMTATSQTEHLSESQLDDYLIGDLAAGPAAHLAACSLCTARVAAAEAPIAAFKTVSLAWSERRSATLPLTPQPRPARWGQRLAWATAMSAALLTGISIPVLRHGSHGTTPSVPATASFDIASSGPVSSLTDEQQIQNDDQMLRSMNSALAVHSDTPLLLQPVAQTSATRAHRLQD